jgi:two-component sensor histidine kinase
MPDDFRAGSGTPAGVPFLLCCLMRQYRKVTGLVLAVLAPFVALSAFALLEFGTDARRDIERTIRAKVDGCLAATEREAARHVAAIQTLGAALDGDLPHLRRHAEAVLGQMRPDWLTVVLAEGRFQVFNLRLPDGAPLPPTLDPSENERVRLAGRPRLGGVTVDGTRLPEPFVTLRTPVVREGGVGTSYVLLAAVRAWAFNETLRQCGLPTPEWRIGLVDSELRIVARTVSGDPLDPYVGQLSSETFREGLRSGDPYFISVSLDGLRTFVGVARSARFGWTASVSVPVTHLEAAVMHVWVFAGGIALAGLLSAAVTCLLALRSYARVATTERLEASLREKDTLLREIHHRVKNNLQAMWGMMRFECRNIRDPYARERMDVIMERVLVLGRIHQQLYESGSLSRIDFARHLRELIDAVRESIDDDRIKLVLDAELLNCDLEVALPLGLITYELISNAQKHAFPDGRAGTVAVSLGRMDDAVCLAVRDDGAGRRNGSAGIGMTLVHALAKQCEGTVDVAYPGDGCRACVTVPGDRFLDETGSSSVG